MHMRVFPGIISAQKVFFEEIPTCASLEPVEKGGASIGPGEAVESYESAALSIALDGRYAARISPIEGSASMTANCIQKLWAFMSEGQTIHFLGPQRSEFYQEVVKIAKEVCCNF